MDMNVQSDIILHDLFCHSFIAILLENMYPNEQYQNMNTMLTREYLDVRLGGWVDYAPLRIVQLD
ncbi:Sialyltransferase-like protein 1, partial [Mucuna pruriens]